MEDKDNGTDLRFDFHQLVDQDYLSQAHHMIYGTNGSNSFATQNSFANSIAKQTWMACMPIREMFWIRMALFQPLVFNNGNANDYHTPKGQSLWQQVFNPNGRGAGIFVQMNWSCGDGGNVNAVMMAYAAKDAGKTQNATKFVLGLDC